MAYPSYPPQTLMDRGRRSSSHDLLLGSHIYIESRMAPDDMGYVTRPCHALSVYLSPQMFFPEGKYSKILSHYPQIVAVLNSPEHVESFLGLPPKTQLKFFTAEPIVDKKTNAILGWQDKPAVVLGRTLLEADPTLSHWQAAIPYPEPAEPEDDSPPPPPDDGGEGTPYELRPRCGSFHPDDDDDDHPSPFDFKP